MLKLKLSATTVGLACALATTLSSGNAIAQNEFCRGNEVLTASYCAGDDLESEEAKLYEQTSNSPQENILIAQSTYDAELLELTNAQRTQNGMRALQYSPLLGQAAQLHAEDMARNDFFDHTGSDGSSISQRISRTGYSLIAVGENIYYQNPQGNPVDAVVGWMNSPGHRRNILDSSFTEVGFGYATDGNNHYFVQVFAAPDNRQTQPSQSQQPPSNQQLPPRSHPIDWLW